MSTILPREILNIIFCKSLNHNCLFVNRNYYSKGEKLLQIFRCEDKVRNPQELPLYLYDYLFEVSIYQKTVDVQDFLDFIRDKEIDEEIIMCLAQYIERNLKIFMEEFEDRMKCLCYRGRLPYTFSYSFYYKLHRLRLYKNEPHKCYIEILKDILPRHFTVYSENFNVNNLVEILYRTLNGAQGVLDEGHKLYVKGKLYSSLEEIIDVILEELYSLEEIYLNIDNLIFVDKFHEGLFICEIQVMYDKSSNLWLCEWV